MKYLQINGCAYLQRAFTDKFFWINDDVSRLLFVMKTPLSFLLEHVRRRSADFQQPRPRCLSVSARAAERINKKLFTLHVDVPPGAHSGPAPSSGHPRRVQR